MKRTKLLTGFLLAALVLTGCSTYSPAVQPGGLGNPAVSRTNETASVAEMITPDTAKSASVKTTDPPVSVRLTKAEAEANALKHAGFAAGQVNGLRSEYDFDDAVPHYDVEFRVGQWEYEYEIHAETGAVLSFEKDD